MAKGKAHSDETRAAVMAALLAGQGVPLIAKEYKLPESTVRHIKKSIDAEKFAEVCAKKEETFTALIENHLRTSLTAAANIAEQTGNAEWLNKQDAEKLGVFYGILTDKAVRILEAGEAAQSPGDEPPDV